MDSQEIAPLAHPVAAAGRRIGVSRTAMFGMIERGEIKSFKIGNRRLIPEDELKRIISERLAEAA